jgi:hypothetical protein
VARDGWILAVYEISRAFSGKKHAPDLIRGGIRFSVRKCDNAEMVRKGFA